MVYGLKKFKDYFGDRAHQYVLIGGVACELLLGNFGAAFRATKDLDMVLIVESLDPGFGELFWRFIEDGGYQNREKSTGENQFYRFSHPAQPEFPKTIELFSSTPLTFSLKQSNGMTPIFLDNEIKSLSAILLDDAYYEILKKGKVMRDGYSVLELEMVILFKIKAWIDLQQRKSSGLIVDSKNIRKHFNDVFRLLSFVNPSSRIDVPLEVLSDVASFTLALNQESPDLSHLGITPKNYLQLIDVLHQIYTTDSTMPMTIENPT